MIAIRITRDDMPIFRKRMAQLPKAAGRACYEMAKASRDGIRNSLLAGTKRAPRNKMAEQIIAKKVSDSQSQVLMPLKAIWLDSAKAHYVSLKRGRLITAWASKFYGGMRKAGKSSVRRGARGGIQRGSFLYVTPDPFIARGYLKARQRFPSIIRRELRQALRG